MYFNSFYCRTCLAAIDHNSHVFRKSAFSKSGQPKYSKVFSKRSKNWRVEVVKEPNTYEFWPTLGTRILQKRVDDDDSILRKITISPDNPKNIDPSIALKPIPKTIDLVKKSLSRFAADSHYVSCNMEYASMQK